MRKNTSPTSKYRFALWGICLASLSFFAFGGGGRFFDLAKNLELFAGTYRAVNEEHVDGAEPSHLMRVAIDSMLYTLDPYTNFISEAEMEKYKFLENASKIGNIGATVMKHRSGKIVLKEVFEGFAAQKAGLMPGDELLNIDGSDVSGRTLDQVEMELKGAMGSETNVTVKREGTLQPISAKLTLGEVNPKNVPYYGLLSDGVTGYVILTVFTADAGQNIADAIKDLKQKHNIKNIVLDLRDNGGGLLHEAVNIVNLFVPKGREVVSTKGKVIEWDKSYKTQSDPMDTDIPLIVLINDHSASASEIVSGALQDFDRAVLLGQKSFGKGLVQNVKDLPYNCKVKITTAKYYIPSGRCIQAREYANGVAIEIKDSDRKGFKTKGGRTVYDGGGVLPDLKMPAETKPTILKQLEDEHYIFDFVNAYRRNRDSIPAVKDFMLTEKDWQNFVAFIKNSGFKYEPESSKALAALEIASANEKYKETLSASLESTKNKLKRPVEGELSKYKDIIFRELELEVVARYKFEGGRSELRLRRDKETQAALELLKDKVKFAGLLSPK